MNDIVQHNIRYYEGSTPKVLKCLMYFWATERRIFGFYVPVCIGKYSLEILACIPATAFLPEG
jgi:hypothetical protein